MKHYLVIGQGKIGLALTYALASQQQRVTGVSRHAKYYDESLQTLINHWQVDAKQLMVDELQHITHIAIIVSPDTKTDDRVKAYQNSYLAICQHLATLADALPNIRQVLFVSSTAVYGENGGQVIDESTIVRPNTPTAQVLYQAERVICHAFKDKAVIVRPSGIYGKGRQRMIRLAEQASIDGVPSQHYTNRIMDVDLVSVLVRILTDEKPKALYLATDFSPVSGFEVLSFICQHKNIHPPTPIRTAPTGKKIQSNLPKDWLRFADYRQGYAWILSDDE